MNGINFQVDSLSQTVNSSVFSEPRANRVSHSSTPSEITSPDIVINGFSAFEEIDLADEISGRSVCMAEMVDSSTKYGLPVFSGVKTRLNGFKHLSVVVANSGKLLDIVDRTKNIRDDEFMSSNKIKVYKTEKIVAALLIDTDVLIYKNWEKVVNLCDMVICIGLNFSDAEADLVYSISRVYGLPYIIAGENGLWWSD